MSSDTDSPPQPDTLRHKPTVPINTTKASKSKSFPGELLGLLEEMITYFALYFLTVAIPLGLSFLAIDYFTDKSVSFSGYLAYFAIILSLLLVVAYEIRKMGAKKFWKLWINRDLYYSSEVFLYGKYWYKRIVFGLVLTIFFTLVISAVVFYVLRLFIKW